MDHAEDVFGAGSPRSHGLCLGRANNTKAFPERLFEPCMPFINFTHFTSTIEASITLGRRVRSDYHPLLPARACMHACIVA